MLIESNDAFAKSVSMNSPPAKELCIFLSCSDTLHLIRSQSAAVLFTKLEDFFTKLLCIDGARYTPSRRIGERRERLKRALTLTVILLLILPVFLMSLPRAYAVEAQSLPDDATPLQRAIYEGLEAAREANETVPDAEYLSYGNGTTLTILTYANGTQRSFKETFIVRNVTITISPGSPFILPVNTTDAEATEYITKIQDVLLGFTFEIPRYDWSFEIWDPIIGSILLASGGVTIDLGFGLRLPIQIELEYPEIMVANSLYTLFASVNGLDWTAADYASVGLLPNGNEFLFKFYFRTWLWTFLTGSLFDFVIDLDESRSFSTPIGPGETFPLPRISVPLNPLIEAIIGIDLDLFIDLELEIDPHLGSQKVTANWKAENGATGEGSLLWSHNNERLSFDVQTLNTMTEAEITLTQFRYWFTLFTLDFSLLVDFVGLLFLLPDFEVRLFTLDLSEVIGSLDLYVGVHEFTIGTVTVIVRVIPEVPLGTIVASASMIVALVAYITVPRWGRKRQYTSP